ncbi:MAG TPA: isoleucine--tRNA ligase [Byssovorax sp.]|jgi:isoleucyl-tRNA synthetase
MAKSVFPEVDPKIHFPADEARILELWKARGIFEKTLRADTRATGPSKGTWVFYEGPPTANGMPHNGHVLTRAVKDVFPRYKTMQGYDVPRKGGWDTHGLPVEVEVEKDLHIHGKADIEAYGVKPFIARCIESVFRYTEAWERLTEKIAFWVDQEGAYVTYHQSYVESVWWALSELHKKGLLYRGHRVCWWWPQGGTALSAAEVGWNYKTVDDPSVFVAFPLIDEPGTALCAWTTTPWTLPSNMYAAVNPRFEYAVVEGKGDLRLVVAKELVDGLAKKFQTELRIVKTIPGVDLVGKRYAAPFDLYANAADGTSLAARVHSVIAADFVTLDAGTGVVHVAPAFGEDDFAAHKKLIAELGATDAPLFCAVKPDGTFVDDFAPYAGRFVKAADKDLIKDLAARARLVHSELYRHEYPYCWRADEDPLIQLARPAWYIRTQVNKDKAIENNRAVQWLPEHIKEGRFGDFLANNVDWALSRERFWGTPLNVWVCPEGHEYAPPSTADIERLNPRAFDAFRAARAADPSLNPHLQVHKPWIDEVTLPCPTCGAEARRVTEVIDAWFDSGSMPFAQWGYPHAPGSKERFDAAFPADFISEAIDQTRGWFYSLLMIATLVFDDETQRRLGLSRVRSYPLPYKTCVVLGHVSDREGRKESKSKGNYTPPEVILERVRMEFACVIGAAANVKQAAPGVAAIAREDFEGLDLQGERAKVTVYRGDRESTVIALDLVPVKGLPRRIVALDPADAARLGVEVDGGALTTKPNDVFRLPAAARVFVEDTSAPAPGADAFRWFFYASSPPWTNTRHSLTNVRSLQKEFAIKIRNVHSFFTIYANIDGFDPAAGAARATGTAPSDLASARGYRPAPERSLLDRWLASEIALTTRAVTRALDAYLLYDAATALVDLVDGMSNWYVRRSRDRFWATGDLGAGGAVDAALQDKFDAYFTLYEALVAIAKLAAPFVPFFAEDLYQKLVRAPWPETQPESVHLAAYPVADEAAVDEALAADMRAVRELVSLGLQVRTANRLKVRQPLSRADVVVAAGREGAVRAHEALLKDELNVEEVRLLKPGEETAAVRYTLKPNFRALGPKLGKRVQLAKQVLAKADAGALRSALATDGKVTIDLEGEPIELGPEEIEVAVEAAEGFAAAGSRAGVIVLHTTLTDALREKGLVRELVSRLQAARKELGLSFTDRVTVALDGSPRLVGVVEAARVEIAGEVLAASIATGPAAVEALGDARRELSVDGEAVVLAVRPAAST